MFDVEPRLQPLRIVVEDARHVLDARPVEHAHLRCRLFDRDARLQTGHYRQKHPAALTLAGLRDHRFECGRQPQIGPSPNLDSRKASRRHADNSDRHIVDGDLTADDRRIRREAAAPIRPAEDRDCRVAADAIVLRPQHPAKRRLDAQP